MTDLPEDIIRLLIAAAPMAFLGVSKTARTAAIAAISGRIRLSAGVAYNGNTFTLRREHDCFLSDVCINGRGVCDIIDDGASCRCIRSGRNGRWLTHMRPTIVRVHYREIILVVLAAAAISGRVLPDNFGD